MVDNKIHNDDGLKKDDIVPLANPMQVGNGLDAVVEAGPTQAYDGDFTGKSNESFAIYQYSMFEDSDSCQIWYGVNNNPSQLFVWENTSGNSFCNLAPVITYKTADGMTYFIVNSYRRGALSFNECMIFGADQGGSFSMIYDIQGTILQKADGSLQVEETIMNLGADGTPDYNTETYTVVIEGGKVLKSDSDKA